MYLIGLRKAGRQVATVNTYASELSHFIRFLHAYGITLIEVEDDSFYLFASYLVRQGARANDAISGSHINRLVSRALDFLSWLQHRLPVGRLVGVNGEHARVTVTRSVVRGSWGKGGLHHGCMVPRSIRRVVRPLPDDSLDRLLGSCALTSKTSYVRARNRCMVVLLADSGIRREELVHVTTQSIREASVNGWRLTVRCSKRPGNPDRQVPIPEVTGTALLGFLTVQRAVLFQKLSKQGVSDDGWAFCTRSGRQLSPASVTQVFLKLKDAAQIRHSATPHMLRHRWITMQLGATLRQLDGGTPWSIEMLSTVLSRLASRTGHRSIRSLWTYVDWTFEGFETSKSAGKRRTAEQALKEIAAVRQWLVHAEQPGVVEALDRAIAALRALDRSPSLSETGHSARDEGGG
jgi:site-specific recombinase XerD